MSGLIIIPQLLFLNEAYYVFQNQGKVHRVSIVGAEPQGSTDDASLLPINKATVFCP